MAACNCRPGVHHHRSQLVLRITPFLTRAGIETISRECEPVFKSDIPSQLLDLRSVRPIDVLDTIHLDQKEIRQMNQFLKVRSRVVALVTDSAFDDRFCKVLIDCFSH